MPEPFQVVKFRFYDSSGEVVGSVIIDVKALTLECNRVSSNITTDDEHPEPSTEVPTDNLPTLNDLLAETIRPPNSYELEGAQFPHWFPDNLDPNEWFVLNYDIHADHITIRHRRYGYDILIRKPPT